MATSIELLHLQKFEGTGIDNISGRSSRWPAHWTRASKVTKVSDTHAHLQNTVIFAVKDLPRSHYLGLAALAGEPAVKVLRLDRPDYWTRWQGQLHGH